ncbi:phage tail tape measure protein [Leptotrichia massiliensis]|uniref:phage tail tape measure protein n=1 Tax=Leptotrichia massiliensis TaxID=1852388 RepID=UPI0008DB0032|nr:phage tail tape measure protein [Leptotrichia massiliensis]
MAKNMELNIVMSAAVAGALTGMAQVANAMKGTAKSAEELSKKAKELEKAQRALEKVEKLKSAYVNVSKEYLNAARKLHELKEAYNKTGQSNTELAKKIKEQEKVVNSLNKQKERQKHVFEAARSAIEGENQSLGSYKSQLTKVNSELEKMNKLKEAQKRYQARQENIGKVKEFGDRTFNRGIATAGALAVPMKVYMDVEESQADLRKMLGDEAKKYYADIRKISENSPLSQPELYEIAGSLAQSGIVGDQIVEYTNKAQQLKVAFDMSTQASGEFLAKTKEQLGLTKEQVFAFADTINYMADNTASSAAQLVDFSNRVGGVAKTMGIAKEANIAFGATLISMGKQPEVAATGIKQLYLELGKGADTKRKASAFEFLGLNGDQIAQDMAKDAEGTILKVLEKIKGLNTADKAGVLNDLFGEQAIDSIATLSNQTDKLRENLVKAKSEMANGAVEKEYKNRMDTLANSLKLAKNQMMNALADLGLALAPTIKSAVEALTPMIKKVAEWIRQNPKLASGIMKAVASFALLSLGVGGAIKVFSPLFSTISKGILIFDKFKIAGNFAGGLKTAFPIINKLGPAMMKLGPLLSNPYVLAGAVIVGVFVLLYAKWKWFRDGVNNGIKQIAPHFKAVADTLKNAFGQLSSSATKELGKMKPLFDSLKPVLSVIGNVIKFVIIGALMEMNVRIKVLVAIFKVAFTAIRVVVVVVFNVIKTIIIGAVAVIKGIVMTLVVVFKAVWTAIKVVAVVVWAAICVVIITAVTVIKAIFRPFAPFFKAIWNKIKAAAIAVWNAIKSKAMALWGGLKSGFEGVKSSFSTKWNEIKTKATEVWNGVKSAFDTMAGGLKKAIDGVADYFKKAWDGIKNFAANNPISAGIGGLFGQKWTGTNYFEGGLTTVAERGAELIQIPGKPAFLAESEMLLNLPKGTRILNNSQTRSTLRDKVANLKDRVSNLKGGNSYGGNNYSIVINVNGGNPSEVERIVRKVIAGDINKRERTAFG